MRHLSQDRQAQIAARLQSRRRKEKAFRACGALATLTGVVFLGFFLVTIAVQAVPAFSRTFVTLEIDFDAEGGSNDGEAFIASVDYDALLRAGLWRALPSINALEQRREALRLLSIGAPFAIRDALERNPALLGTRAEVRVPASAHVDTYHPAEVAGTAAGDRQSLSSRQIRWIDQLKADGRLARQFNRALFTNGDSREPELAGIRGALIGSLFMLLVVTALALPVGVAAAIYLQEFAPKSRWTDIIEVNINNLAAVPPIIFGLLGLAVFIDLFGMGRSMPVVGGLVLSLLTLPVVIIAARAGIDAVPDGIRDAALALGASRMQTVFHHVLPLAMPRILTGAILGLGRALGETAPLLMIGMVAFIADVPTRLSDPATALPVQIYLWADAPERAFVQQTAAAIVVLLVVLLLMNLGAVIMRRRLEFRNKITN